MKIFSFDLSTEAWEIIVLGSLFVRRLNVTACGQLAVAVVVSFSRNKLWAFIYLLRFISALRTMPEHKQSAPTLFFS